MANEKGAVYLFELVYLLRGGDHSSFSAVDQMAYVRTVKSQWRFSSTLYFV